MSVGRIIYEFFFLGFVLYYIVKFFLDWRSAWALTGFGWVFDTWPFLELVNLIAFLAVFSLRWVWWGASQKEKWTLPFPDKYPENLDYIQGIDQAATYLNSLNIMICFLKILKFVRLNDKLNILPRTLEACTQNILGILILFVLILFAYSITGMTLFGIGVEAFRNLLSSFSTCMLIVISGPGDFYKEMKQENRPVAFIYFWTFVVFANFVLLNFLPFG